MTATRQMAIILAFVAIWEIKIEQMATVWEKSSRLSILFLLISDFGIFLVSLLSWIAISSQWVHIHFLIYCYDWDLNVDASEQHKIKLKLIDLAARENKLPRIISKSWLKMT